MVAMDRRMSGGSGVVIAANPQEKAVALTILHKGAPAATIEVTRDEAVMISEALLAAYRYSE